MPCMLYREGTHFDFNIHVLSLISVCGGLHPLKPDGHQGIIEELPPQISRAVL